MSRIIMPDSVQGYLAKSEKTLSVAEKAAIPNHL